MPVGTQLSVLRQMLNAECGTEMDETVSPASVAVNNQLLNNQQSFLVNQYAYLRGKTRVELVGVVGQQYYALPAGIDFDRLEKPAFTNVSNFRYTIGFGIGQAEYNIFRSDLGVRATPVMRWDMVNTGGALMIELWPIPSVPQNIELAGLLPLTQMVADTDMCVVDDLVLVLFTAAELLARKEAGDAQAKAAKAKAALMSIRATYPSKYESFNLAGVDHMPKGFQPPNSRRPVVAVNGPS
jgi:hypothetical protein